MLSMEYFRQKALSLFGAIYVVPLFEVLCITMTSVIGMVYFEEYVGWETVDVALYILGILVVIAGVLVLSLDVGKIWDDLYEDAVNPIKTAFIDPDKIDYKYPKTMVFGGIASEWFAKKELTKQTMTYRTLPGLGDDDEAQMTEHIAGASSEPAQEAGKAPETDGDKQEVEV